MKAKKLHLTATGSVDVEVDMPARLIISWSLDLILKVTKMTTNTATSSVCVEVQKKELNFIQGGGRIENEN